MTIRLFENLDQYTKSDLKIIEYIECRTDDFLYMSIGQLAEALEMSEATISRCVRHMGYGDYKELKRSIIKRKRNCGPAEKIAGTLRQKQGFQASSWMNTQIDYLNQTIQHLDMDAFGEAVKIIKESRRIYIHGKNASASASQLLFYRLRRLGVEVTLITSGSSEIVEAIAHTKKEDAVIFFGLSKISREGKMILEYSRQVKYKTIAFSGRTLLLEDEQADVNLYVYRGEKGVYHSMTAAVAVVDMLVLAVADAMQGEAAENLNKVQKLKELYR